MCQWKPARTRSLSFRTVRTRLITARYGLRWQHCGIWPVGRRSVARTPHTGRTEPLKILLVGSLPPPANGMTVITDLIVQSSLGESFRLIHSDTSDHREINKVGKVDTANVLLAFKHAVVFTAQLVRSRPHVVHIPIARTRLAFIRDCLFLLPARLSGSSVVAHLHSRLFAEFYCGETPAVRFLIRLAIRHKRLQGIVLGKGRQHDFGELIPPERIHVVPNGVRDIGSGRPPEEREPVILHLSTLCREKGAFDVMAAAARLRESVPNLRLVLAGGWYRVDEEAEARSFIEKNGLERMTEIVGPVGRDEKTDLLREASVFAFPTMYAFEGHPLVILEALSAGTPVVASSVAAIPEMITDGEEGFLINAPDLDALTERLAVLLSNAPLRGRMGRAARRRFERDFTSDLFLSRLANIWNLIGHRLPEAPGVRGARDG